MSRGDLYGLLLFMSIYPSRRGIWFGWTLINRHYTPVCILWPLFYMGISIFPCRHQHGIGYVDWRFIVTGWAEEWTWFCGQITIR